MENKYTFLVRNFIVMTERQKKVMLEILIKKLILCDPVLRYLCCCS